MTFQFKPQPLRRNTFSGSTGLPGFLEKLGQQRGEDHSDRNRGLDDPEQLRRAIGENFRDADDAARVSPPITLKEFVMVYAEPMFVSLPYEPTGGLIALRVIRDPFDPTPVLAGSAVDFSWDGATARAQINSIDGLTPDGSQYRFIFLVVG